MLPLLALSLWFEGPAAIAALGSTSLAGWLAIAWQAWGNTLFGFGVWAWLLARHPAATVSPWALLVPVAGMTSSAIAYGEPMPPWKLTAGGLVLAGLAVNALWPRLQQRRRA